MKTTAVQNICGGVDTGKTQLNIYLRSIDHFFSVENNESGIKKAIKILKQYSLDRIVIEATGRLKMPFVLACAEHQFPIVRANIIYNKRFAGAIGRQAKNDRLDAQLIAHYAEVIKPKITQLQPEKYD